MYISMYISRIYNYIYIMYSHGWISGYQCNPHIVDASCGKPSNKPSRTSPEMDGINNSQLVYRYIQLLGSHIVNSTNIINLINLITMLLMVTDPINTGLPSGKHTNNYGN